MRLSLKEQQLFVKRLVVFLQAGLPLLESLRSIEAYASVRTAHITRHLVQVVSAGGNLAQGMRKYASIFGTLAVSLIEVGETTGTLPAQLEFITSYISGRQTMRRKIVTALVYPIFVIVLALGVSLMLLLYVFPRLMPVFASLHFKLPATTRLLLWVYGLVIHDWIVIIIGAVLAGACVRMIISFERVRSALESIALRIPLLGSYIMQYQSWHVCRTLAVLLKAELSLVVALQKTIDCSNYTAYLHALAQAKTHVLNGGLVSDSFANHPRLFARQILPILAMGEQTGTLSSSLQYLATLLEADTQELTEKASALFEPALLLCVGVMVGFVAIAIISPIYGITQSLQF